MAENWIRMRAGLLTNPKVIRMARILAENRKFIDWWIRGTPAVCRVTIFELCDVTVVTRVTAGSLLSLWASVNESASKDNFVKGITLFEVDAMAGVPGFGDALVTVGWAEVRHDGIVFPNFDEHNTTEKARSDKGSAPKTAAQRTREWRERRASQNVTENVTENVTGDVTRDVTQCDESDVTVTPREEKSREENISKPIEANASVDSGEKPPSADLLGDAPSKILSCPVQRIVDAYHELMPDNPRVRNLNDTRRKLIAARWKEAARMDCRPFGYSTTEDGMKAWRKFFAVCARSDFLTGKAKAQPGKPPFLAEIDWLMNATNFTKIIENKYHREAE